jgi:hypothetical protein
MDTSIFIRSYAKDFRWLSYCVQSIKKYCSGFSEVVLTIPKKEESLLPSNISDHVTRVMLVKEETHGYIAQQVTKLLAHTYCMSDNIMYVDSDCVFFENCTPLDFCKDNKPILLKTNYEVFRKYQNETGRIQNVLNWKNVTERAVKFNVDYEYMRRIPLIHTRDTLQTLNSTYPDLVKHCLSITDNSFSEFNVIGAIAEKYHADQYYIQDTEVEALPKKFVEQYWSWGGLTKEIEENLKCVCS